MKILVIGADGYIGKTFNTYRGFRIHQGMTGHKLPVDKIHVKEIEVMRIVDDSDTAVYLKIEPITTDIASCIRYALTVLEKSMKEVDLDE